MSDRLLLIGAGIGALVLVVGSVVAASAVSSPISDPGAGFGAGPVTAATPIDPSWAGVASGLTAGVDPSSDNDCVAGRVACVDAVVAEMEARLDRLDCAHTAPFAFTYLEMTRGVAARLDDPAFFADAALLAHLDALFATLYFDAFDNWAAGRHDEVPGAWQMAFDAADSRSSSAAADLLLGMNAHISRDLAYTVAQVLESAPATDRNDEDFTLVNSVIAEVRGPLLVEVAERFDPMLAGLEEMLAPAAEVDAAALIGIWRGQAFDLGTRLAEAPNDAARRAVESEIERNAVAAAAAILNGDAVFGQGLDAEKRLDYCRRPR